jgi:thioesterase domain-containing protein
MTLIRARTFGLTERVSADRVRRPFVEAVDVSVVASDHATILQEPHVATLADLIATRLAT